MNRLDTIIVGSGIAGITLAWELYRRDKTFIIISNPSLSKASIIAPGVWNPIVFKRISPTWNASHLINALLPFYEYVEQKLDQRLIKSFDLLHCISNVNEEKLWKQKQELYPKFLQDIVSLKKYQHPFLKNDLHCGKVDHAGRLNVSEYLYYSIEFFQSINAYVEGNFDYNNLIIDKNAVFYGNWVTNHIVFCEGHLLKYNPYFKFVKLQPAKGEIIEIETEHSILPENIILHKQISIIPHAHCRYFIGSNYEWKDLNEQPTEAIRKKFLSMFEAIFNVSYQVIGHYAGIRPAADRRPILGNHPEFSNVHIFNGLGTKGVMLAPYCAMHLVDSIFCNKNIPGEMNVNRFVST